MAYDNIISRTDASALIPPEYAREIIDGIVEESVALNRFRRVNMSTNQMRMPVLSALPVAYFTGGDTGLKQTTELNWSNKYLNVEEIAVIVPMPDAVFDDAAYDIWAESRPRLIEAIGRTLDAAVFFGTNKPSSWPTDITAAAVSAGNVVARGTATTAQGGIAGDISETMATVEADGFDVNTIVTSRGYRGHFRNLRDVNGQPLMSSQGEIYNTPVVYALNGQWPSGASVAELFAMDASQYVIGVRQDITWKLLDQAVIQDNSGNIIYNLAQQDMKAMRVTFRVAWQVSNYITTSQTTESARYPAAVLRSPA
jgi:HK97 family phage major capsid protein